MIPEELYSRLLFWLQAWLTSHPKSDTDCGGYKVKVSIDTLLSFDFFTQLFFGVHGLDHGVITADNSSQILSSVVDFLADEGSPPKASMQLRFLGDLYRQIFLAQNQPEDINEAIKCFSQALSRTPDTHPARSDTLGTLSILFYHRFNISGELGDQARACDYGTQAVSLAVIDHPSRPGLLDNIGALLCSRFASLGKPEDLELAYQYHNQAQMLTYDEDPEKPIRLNNLSSILLMSYHNHSGQLLDLNRAIECERQANALVSSEHVDKPMLLSNLGGCYQTRYDRLGVMSDLDAAVDCASQAVALCPKGHSKAATMLRGLGIAHHLRYERINRLSDLELAISHHELADTLTPDGHLQKPMILDSLGISYLSRYKRLGLVEDLDTSIAHHIHAVNLTPDGHRHMPMRIGKMGNSYELRFERLGEMQDLDTAIELTTKADSLTPDSHPMKPSHLSNLGDTYQSRYCHLGQLADLEAAITSRARAILLTPDDHQAKPTRLNDLGLSYHQRYKHSAEQLDFNLATSHMQQALSLTPESHPDTSTFLLSLGGVHGARYLCLKEYRDLNLAIQYTQSAISIMPKDHLDRCDALRRLGERLFDKFSHFGNPADILNSNECLKQAANLGIGDPQVKMAAASQWVIQCAQFLPQACMETLECYMSLIPQVVWLGAGTQQRYNQVTKIAKGVLTAAACAAQLNESEKALEWLEQGRSVVWNQMLQIRDPLDSLRSVDASLAEEMRCIARKLRATTALNPEPVNLAHDSDSREHAAQCHRRLVKEWERLVRKAQSLADNNDFLAPNTAPHLMRAAQNGAVVEIVVTNAYCCALIIPLRDIEVSQIRLPNVSHDKLVQAWRMLSHQLDRGSRVMEQKPAWESDQDYNPVLAMLWTDIAKPVLDFLGYNVSTISFELPVHV
ncbi:hypothetical protein FRC12_019079 [Ceratobasidium sp. 428]|nr:hypothetical protein FRC12_019079 [Ceratobasidium sp. 428]